jgi:hypothetical protein
VPAEDLESDGIGRPHVRRQNNCFLVSMVGVALAILMFVVGTVYMAPGENPITKNEFSPESGIVGDDAKEKLSAGFASIANSNKHHENTAMENWLIEHGVGGGNTTRGENATKLDIQHGAHGHSKVTGSGKKPHPGNGGIHNQIGSTMTPTTQTPNTAGGAAQNGGVNAPANGSGDNAPAGNTAPPMTPQEVEAYLLAEIAAWNNKTVTLADGIVFEVVDQLVHDPTAFTYVLYRT